MKTKTNTSELPKPNKAKLDYHSDAELSDQEFLSDPPSDLEELLFDKNTPFSTRIGPWKRSPQIDERGLQPHKTLFDLCLFGSRSFNMDLAGEAFEMFRTELGLVTEYK